MTEPAPTLAPSTRHAERLVVWDGVCSRLMDTFTGGPFLVGLALFVGANTFLLTVVAALPFLAQAAQIWAVRSMAEETDRRLVVVVGAGLGRVFLFGIGLVLLLQPAILDAGLLVVLLAGAALLGVLATAAWNWWMRDLLPRGELGRFFGGRLGVTTLVAAVLTPVAGLFLDWMAQRGSAATGYSGLFLAGGLAGFVGLVFLGLTPHPPARGAVRRGPVLQAMVAHLQEPSTKRLAIALVLVATTITIALPFTAVFMLRSLRLSFLVVSLLVLTSQLAYIGSLRGWGLASDRAHDRPVLQIATGLLVVSLLGWTFAGWTAADRLVLAFLFFLHFVGGFALAGIELTAHNVLLKTAPDDGAPSYLATLSVLRALCAGVATLAAGALWQGMGTAPLWVFDLPGATTWSVRGFHVLAAISALVGLVAVVALERVPVAEGAHVRDVARLMRREVRAISSVAGIRAFFHAVSYAVEFVVREGPRRGRSGTMNAAPEDSSAPSAPSAEGVQPPGDPPAP